MRFFSAFALTDEAAAVLSQHRGGLRDARWVEPIDYHITLAFFGEVDGATAEDLVEALAEIEADAVDLRLTGLGAFGADRPHAIVAFVEKSPQLLSLEAAHRAIAKRLRIGDHVRKYTPHVTLARLRRTTAGEVANWISTQPALEPLTWSARRFALYSSRTSRGGGPYVAEAEFELRD